MFCPRCETEYRPGFARCPDCDVELVPSLPSPDVEETSTGVQRRGDQVMVYASPNPVVGHLIAGVLANEGIQYTAYGGSDPAYPIPSLSEFTILVAVEDAGRARRLIEAAERGEFAVDE
jgi:hypothetical protein